MGVNVNSIDTVKVKQDLKSCPKSVRDYVRSLESLYESQKDLNTKCITRVRELSLENNSLIASRQTYATECVKASLEKAYKNGEIIYKNGQWDIAYKSITSSENIVLV